MSGDRASAVGLVSLWTSVAGIIIAVVLIALLGVDGFRPYYPVGLALFFGAEFVALFTGISDRGSPAGKAGLLISSVSLAIGVLVLILVLPVRVGR